MGLCDRFLSKLIVLLCQSAIISDDPTQAVSPIDVLAWHRARVLIVDGSLFYRRFHWDRLGPIWANYLDAVWAGLVALMDRCTELETLVFLIDKYGPGTREPLPKRVIQAHRYEGAVEVPNAASKFAPEKPVAGLDSTNVFGNLDTRMAFNEMVTRFLAPQLAAYCKGRGTMQHAIIDGAVYNGTARVMMAYEAPHAEPTPADPWLPHSEGDIGIGHWLSKFGHKTTMIESADVDIQQVVLRVIQRWADAGLRPAQFADVFLHKLALPVDQMFDMKIYYQSIVSVVGARNAAPDFVHPMDIWTMLTATGGNDFCTPWLCSAECANGSKSDSDGISIEAIWYTLVKDFQLIGPLFEPTTEADAWQDGAPWSVLRVPTYVYPIRPRVDAWVRLMKQAAHYQAERCRAKIAGKRHLLDDRQYVMGQLRRMTWSVCYYANAALLGDRMPSGIETDPASGLSLHGWVPVPGARPPKDVVRADSVAHPDERTLHGLWGADCPTRPPSPCAARPKEDPLDAFNRLAGEIDD